MIRHDNFGRKAVSSVWRLFAEGREALEEWLFWLAVHVTYRTRWGDCE
jgi:hypothetical protein